MCMYRKFIEYSNLLNRTIFTPSQGSKRLCASNNEVTVIGLHFSRTIKVFFTILKIKEPKNGITCMPIQARGTKRYSETAAPRPLKFQLYDASLL